MRPLFYFLLPCLSAAVAFGHGDLARPPRWEPGPCGDSTTPPPVLAEIRGLLGTMDSTALTRRFIFGLAPVPSASIHLFTDTLTCRRALQLYRSGSSGAGTRSDSGGTTAVFVIAAGPYWVVEDADNAFVRELPWEVAIYGTDWRVLTGYGGGQ